MKQWYIKSVDYDVLGFLNLLNEKGVSPIEIKVSGFIVYYFHHSEIEYKHENNNRYRNAREERMR